MRLIANLMFIVVIVFIPLNMISVIIGNMWSVIPLVIGLIGFACFLLGMHEEQLQALQYSKSVEGKN